MIFSAANVEYDQKTERGYVEFRAGDNDGDDVVIAAILSFRSKSKLTRREIKQQIVRKARLRQ